jgi:hypothetical protein
MKSIIKLPILILLITILLITCIKIGVISGVKVAIAETSTILSAYPNWFFNGNTSGENMGSAVSAAGDVNGDGEADVLVGAQKYTLNQYREGAAFVFYGSGGGLSSIPDWKMGGGQQGTMYGCELKGLGDVNADGFDDITVGACELNLLEGSTITKSKVGAAYVYYGEQNFAAKTDPDWELIGDQAEARLGSALSGFVDEQQDESIKYADLLVGTPYYDSIEKINVGKVALFLGSDTGLGNSSVWEVVGETSSALFGNSVDNAGDVNNNGYDDVIIGAPRPSSIGYAYVFLNSADGLSTTHSWRVSDEESGSSFGTSVAGVGDVNKDGYDDVLVGAPTKKILIDEVSQAVGCVSLYLGSSGGLSTTSSWTYCADQVGGQFGASVAAAGDINQDGYADFLVGMPFFSTSNEKQGAIFLFFGSNNSSGVNSDYFESTFGNKADTEFGTSVSTAGDVNNDGLLDVIAGAPNYKASGYRVGRVMVYYAGIPGIPDFDVFSVFLPLVSSGN